MPDLADLAGSADTWLIFIASTVLAAAAGGWRRVSASLARLGARVGRVEQELRSERTRRRQVEATLLDLGLPLPYWPEDPPELQELGRAARRVKVAAAVAAAAARVDESSSSGPRRPAPAPRPPAHDQDAEPDFLDSAEYAAVRPSVPPLSTTEQEHAARHRRPAPSR